MAESKNTQEVRSEKSQLSCYPHEDELLQRAADRMGIPKATYARIAALEKARRDLGASETPSKHAVA